MNKDKEPWVFDSFKNLYKAFPQGESIRQDKPDYILQTDNKLIGIEITEAVIDPLELERYRFQVLITDEVLNQLKDKLPFTFYITVDPKKDAVLPIKKRKKVVKELVDLCVRECMELKNLEHYRVHDFGGPIDSFPISVQKQILDSGNRNLPEDILEISIGRYDVVGKSWNGESTAMVVPDFTTEKLKQILVNKEEKLKDYAKCDEHWLLVWGSGLPQSYYSNVEIEEPLDTAFEKVFFIRPEKDLTEITTIKGMTAK